MYLPINQNDGVECRLVEAKCQLYLPDKESDGVVCQMYLPINQSDGLICQLCLPISESDGAVCRFVGLICQLVLPKCVAHQHEEKRS